MRLLERWTTVGAVSGGVIGAIVGLIIGLGVRAATAWFAAFELGVPAAIGGGFVGCIAALIAIAGRRVMSSAAAPSPPEDAQQRSRWRPS
jgi:hypothetical protein